MHHHNSTYGIGIAVLFGGVGLLVFSLMGFARRASDSGQKLRSRDPSELRGKPFAGRNYYLMKWAPINTAVSVAIMLVGAVLLLVS